jgi:hypothetical protein
VPAGEAFRQQIVVRRLLKEGIAAGQQEGVPAAPFHRLEQDFPLIDADPDRRDRAAAAQAFEGAVAAVAQAAHQRRMGLAPCW